MTDFGTALRWYQGRSVLVTGHTGFKGSWLTLWLHDLGAKVHGYSLPPPTVPSNFEASRVGELCASQTEADVRDVARLEQALRTIGPEVIFHLAAQSLVRDGYRHPAETFDVNLMGTVRLLDAVRVLGRPVSMVIVTSDKCYQNSEQTSGYRESDPMGGDDPYSASKGATELAVAAFRRSFFSPERLAQHGVKISSARAGNVIGGGDWGRDRIVSDTVLALHAGQPVPVRNPHAVRPWQHVLEPLSGYLILGHRLATSDEPRWTNAWNFGPAESSAIPVSRLVEAFIESWGGGRWEATSSADAFWERRVLRLSVERAVAELGWRPRWTVLEAVARAASWYRAFYEGSHDMRDRCREDIQSYLNPEVPCRS
ncbi:MAG: CDP-glucose 4,6-dehydratase [Deltaproteobacteria bacterium]|nr:CDP-glucose 4,6-dehydratase [Deltaproteobacteria bacterium]